MPKALPALVAVRVPAGSPIAPFGDLPSALPVLNRPLAAVQELALTAAGVQLVAEAPSDRPYVLLSDRVWFTDDCVRRLIAAGPGRLCIDDADWTAQNALAPDANRPELALCPAGHPPRFEGLADRAVDLGFTKVDPPVPHPAFAHAMAGRWVAGPAMALDVDHWLHLLRANLLALVAVGAQAHATFAAAGPLKKVALALPVLWRARGLNPAAIGRAVSRFGRGCKIHPTAVIEATELGDDVTVGPHAVVQGCVVGDGATIDAQAWCVASVVGKKGFVGRNAGITLCLLMDGAFVSWGAGRQMCVFGRDSFLAMDCTLLDLSFGGPVKVAHAGARHSSGGHFLGSAVGHRAKIGAGVRVGYGAEVPNDALLVAPAHDLMRSWSAPAGAAAVVEEGVARPVRRA